MRQLFVKWLPAVTKLESGNEKAIVLSGIQTLSFLCTNIAMSSSGWQEMKPSVYRKEFRPAQF